jgi:hypothetical protein
VEGLKINGLPITQTAFNLNLADLRQRDKSTANTLLPELSD